jgi:hypothetical protein
VPLFSFVVLFCNQCFRFKTSRPPDAYEYSRTETKKNLIENQHQIQYQAQLRAQRTVLSGKITAPPSASVPVTSSLVFNALHLPSPDSEREEH